MTIDERRKIQEAIETFEALQYGFFHYLVKEMIGRGIIQLDGLPNGYHFYRLLSFCDDRYRVWRDAIDKVIK